MIIITTIHNKDTKAEKIAMMIAIIQENIARLAMEMITILGKTDINLKIPIKD